MLVLVLLATLDGKDDTIVGITGEEEEGATDPVFKGTGAVLFVLRLVGSSDDGSVFVLGSDAVVVGVVAIICSGCCSRSRFKPKLKRGVGSDDDAAVLARMLGATGRSPSRGIDSRFGRDDPAVEPVLEE